MEPLEVLVLGRDERVAQCVGQAGTVRPMRVHVVDDPHRADRLLANAQRPLLLVDRKTGGGDILSHLRTPRGARLRAIVLGDPSDEATIEDAGRLKATAVGHRPEDERSCRLLLDLVDDVVDAYIAAA